jgi:DNA polymerase IV (DinB-like DNA polymerase)
MRIVLHIDMDAFFASVEERDHPRVKGLPIVVGSDPANGKGRGVVSTANYAARKYGIKSAIPISRAWQLSQKAKAEGKPEAVFFEPNIRKYAEISREIFSYIASKGDVFQAGGIDECYLELLRPATEYHRKHGRVFYDSGEWEGAREIAREIQEHVQKEFRLSCSIGVGPNKLIAKIAAGREKPHGLTLVREEEVQDFLDPLSVRELWGIGPKTGAILAEFGVQTIEQLRKKSKVELMESLGKKSGESAYLHARGIDDAPLETHHEAKSISSETTFEKDTLDAPTILATLKQMSTEVAKLVRADKKQFKTVGIVVRFSDFETKTRSHTLTEASDSERVLESEVLKLFMPFLDSRENPERKKTRLVGVRAEKLESMKHRLF